MGKIFRIFVLLGILTLIVSACSTDDGYSLDTRYLNLGRIEGVDGDTENGFNVRLDDGTWLLINNSRSIKGFKDGDRIQLIYTLIGEYDQYEGYKRFLAIFNYGHKLFSKEPLLQSTVDDEGLEESIGDDPIRVDKAWFGGRYLNIEFSVPRKVNSRVTHYINLVADDRGLQGVLNLYLQHNGYEDVPKEADTDFKYSDAFVFFDLLGLVPEGSKAVEVKLHWTDFTGTDWSQTKEYTDSGVFTPYASADTSANGADYSAGDENII